MKKTLLYIATVGILAGSLMWRTPAVSYAAPEETVAEEAAGTEGDDVTTAIEAAEEAEVSSTVEDTEVEDEEEDSEEDTEISPLTAKEEAEEDLDTSDLRQSTVAYALSFVGGKYRAGGNDPHTGADCSGFVKYVMQNAAGVYMNRSSSSQAGQGVAISAAQMQPGDLLFYGSGRGINHVAMYIGNGQIVHASTYKTGIKTSAWNYRTPVKIVSMLG